MKAKTERTAPTQRRWRGPALAAALLCATAFATPAAAQSLADLARATKTAKASLFGSVEFEAGSFKGPPQWARVIEKMRRIGPAFEACAADIAACDTKVLKTWRDVLETAGDLPPSKRLAVVNQAFNRWPYREDIEVYGVSEYWATPPEFMRLSGDCEDFAIAKFFALRQLGFANEELRVVILWDQIRNIGHAVLTIHGGEAQPLVLDSLSDFIVPHSRYNHYLPQYSTNETTRWAHVSTDGRPLVGPSGPS